jgi:hypothetical protein
VVQFYQQRSLQPPEWLLTSDPMKRT